MSELYLVRHAQASFGAEQYDNLSPTGVDQSRLLGRFFAEQEIEFDGVVSGVMQRHRQTIDALREQAIGENTVEQTHAGLNEYDFRTMMRVYCEVFPADELVAAVLASPDDRKTYFRLLRRVLTAWSEDQLHDVPESWSSFQERVADARSMLQSMATQSKRVLVVSSGGAISMFVGSVLGLSPNHIFDLNLQILNTSITRFFFDTSKISLAEFNAAPHLLGREQAHFRTYS
ncbi:MAG: histidine phosphatase family protein [Woeseiaceae bacterium]